MAAASHCNYECFAPFAREEVILTKVRVIKNKKSAKGVISWNKVLSLGVVFVDDGIIYQAQYLRKTHNGRFLEFLSQNFISNISFTGNLFDLILQTWTFKINIISTIFKL